MMRANSWLRFGRAIAQFTIVALAAVGAIAIYRTHGLRARIWNGYDGAFTDIAWNGTPVVDRIERGADAIVVAPPVASESGIEISFTHANARQSCNLNVYLEPNTSGRIEIALRPTTFGVGTTAGIILWRSPIDILISDPWPEGSATVSCAAQGQGTARQ